MRAPRGFIFFFSFFSLAAFFDLRGLSRLGFLFRPSWISSNRLPASEARGGASISSVSLSSILTTDITEEIEHIVNRVIIRGQDRKQTFPVQRKQTFPPYG